MSAFVVIPEERWMRMEQHLANLEAMVSELCNRYDADGSQNGIITGKKKIAKVIGCAEAVVSELCRTHALGILLWKPASEARNTHMHLDNPQLAKQRYLQWLSMDDNVKQAMLQLPNSTYIEEYWHAKFNL